MPRSLGWGIVGTGWVADTVMASAINADPRSHVVAIASRRQSTAEAFATRHAVRYAYSSYSDLLANPDVQVVYVATPNALHADAVIAAARAGKHILCEKPLAVSSQKARDAVAASSKARVRLGVNFHARHHRAMARANRLLREGAIGRLIFAQVEVAAGTGPLAEWRQSKRLAGLGAVHTVGIHAYDLLRFLLSSEVVKVNAMVDNDGAAQLESVALSVFGFANGTLASITATQGVASYRPRIDLCGTSGRLSIEAGLPFLDGTLRLITESGMQTVKYSRKDVFTRAVRSFNDAVVRGRVPIPSGEDGIRSAEIAEAIVLSSRTGSAVRLLPKART